MTDPNVGTSDPQGADGSQPSVSAGNEKPIAGVPPVPQELLDIKRELELTRKELKGLQSRQDKETNEVQRFMDEVKAQMAKGKSLEEAEQSVYAEREAATEKELLRKIAEKVLGDSPSKSAVGNSNETAVEVAAVFEKYGVPLNDPEAVPLLDLRGANLVDGVASLALKRAKTSIPDSSEAPSLQGPGASRPDLVAQLAELQKDPIKNRKRILEVEKELNW